MYINHGILPYPHYYVLLGDVVELGANLILQKELVDESLECSHGSACDFLASTNNTEPPVLLTNPINAVSQGLRT